MDNRWRHCSKVKILYQGLQAKNQKSSINKPPLKFNYRKVSIYTKKLKNEQ